MNDLRQFFDASSLSTNLLIMSVLVGGLLLYTRAARVGRWLVVGCSAMLVIFGYSPIQNAIRWTLETRFPAWNESAGAPDGIVVPLGASERITAAAELARRYPAARIVLSGGNVSRSGKTEADLAADEMEKLGVSRQRILIEARGRNTAENAEFSKALAQPKPGERWLLVTTALHMPRAMGAFRQVGFPVEAYPVNRRIDDNEVTATSPAFIRGLQGFDTGMYEWGGLIMYRLTGRSSELFPKP